MLCPYSDTMRQLAGECGLGLTQDQVLSRGGQKLVPGSPGTITIRQFNTTTRRRIYFSQDALTKTICHDDRNWELASTWNGDEYGERPKLETGGYLEIDDDNYEIKYDDNSLSSKFKVTSISTKAHDWKIEGIFELTIPDPKCQMLVTSKADLTAVDRVTQGEISFQMEFSGYVVVKQLHEGKRAQLMKKLRSDDAKADTTVAEECAGTATSVVMYHNGCMDLQTCIRDDGFESQKRSDFGKQDGTIVTVDTVTQQPFAFRKQGQELPFGEPSTGRTLISFEHSDPNGLGVVDKFIPSSLHQTRDMKRTLRSRPLYNALKRVLRLDEEASLLQDEHQSLHLRVAQHAAAYIPGFNYPAFSTVDGPSNETYNFEGGYQLDQAWGNLDEAAFGLQECGEGETVFVSFINMENADEEQGLADTAVGSTPRGWQYGSGAAPEATPRDYGRDIDHSTNQDPARRDAETLIWIRCRDSDSKPQGRPHAVRWVGGNKPVPSPPGKPQAKYVSSFSLSFSSAVCLQLTFSLYTFKIHV